MKRSCTKITPADRYQRQISEGGLLFLLTLFRSLPFLYCLCSSFFVAFPLLRRGGSKQARRRAVVVQTRECKKFRRQTRTSKKSDQTSTKSKYPRAFPLRSFALGYFDFVEVWSDFFEVRVCLQKRT